jgi:hypothetical protein
MLWDKQWSFYYEVVAISLWISSSGYQKECRVSVLMSSKNNNHSASDLIANNAIIGWLSIIH